MYKPLNMDTTGNLTLNIERNNKLICIHYISEMLRRGKTENELFFIFSLGRDISVTSDISVRE